LLAWLLAPGARADIVIPEIDDMPIYDPSDNYTFHVFLTNTTLVAKGDFFTIYDIPNLLPATAIASAAPNWNAQFSLLGQTPGGLSPPDSPLIYNITYIYGGAIPIQVPDGQTSLDLGTFPGFKLTVPTPSMLQPPAVPPLLFWASQSTAITGAPVGVQSSTPLTVTFPEPRSIVLLGLGAGLAGIVRQRRRRAAA